MSSAESLQQTIAAWICGTRLSEITELRQELAARSFADALAALAAGMDAEQTHKAAKALRLDMPAPQLLSDCLQADGRRLDRLLVLATAAHSCEFNDLFYAQPGHPGAVLAPTVLLTALSCRADGTRMLESYLCGLEVMGQINRAMIPEHHFRGFHTTATAGVFGAAAAAGKLLGLNTEQMAAALAIAATSAGGLRANLGHEVNSLHVGFAASHGLRAALLARGGIDVCADLLERPDGFAAAFGVKPDALRQAAGRLEQESVLDHPGLLLKRYPTCYSTCQAIDAALALRGKPGFALRNIRQIIILTSPNHYLSLPMRWPDSVYGQRFCIPFCVAMALAGRPITLEGMAGLHADEPELLLLREKIQYGVEEVQKGRTDFGSTLIRLRNADGTEQSARAFPDPADRVEHWTLPRLRAKFALCTEPVLGAKASQTLWQTFSSAEAIRNIRDLQGAVGRCLVGLF